MLLFLMLLAAAPQSSQADKAAPPQQKQTSTSAPSEAAERCVLAGDSPDSRVSVPRVIAPGLPPLFSFRYYEGKLHGRNVNTDLMMDDAGH
jgi:hypothetical protein